MTTDLLQTGADRLRSLNRTHRARSVSYVRAGVSATVTATAGRSEYELRDRQGVAVTVAIRDYLVTAADLDAAFAAFGRPAIGDKIVDGDRTYAVTNAPNGDPCFRETDADAAGFRIHTNRKI